MNAGDLYLPSPHLDCWFLTREKCWFPNWMWFSFFKRVVSSDSPEGL